MSPLARRSVWFCAAIAVPCAALLWLGLRLLKQEHEIGRQRARENQQLKVERVRRELLAALGPILHSRPPSAAIAFEGVIRSGRAHAAWELNPSVSTLRRALTDSNYLRAMRSKQDGPSAFDGIAAGFLTLQRAVAMDEAGEKQVSQALLERIAATRVEEADDFGVPLALYAAARLPPDSRRAALRRIQAEIFGKPLGVSDMAVQMAMSLAREHLRNEGLEKLDALHQNARAAQEFVEAYGRMGGASATRWQLFGRAPFLVGYVGASAPGDYVFRAVRAGAVLPDAEFSLSEGEALGEPFPGLRVKLPAAPESGAPRQRPLIMAVLLIAFVMAIFGSLLLWRDSRREAQLASLRTQFVAGVSHELRTPLTAIRMFTEALYDNPSLAAGKRQEYLSMMLRESERLSRLVENVLEFSRIERNRQSYHLRPLPLSALIRSVLSSLQPLLDQGGFHVEVGLDDDMPAVYADADALGQAISNLIGNAMKYSGGAREIRVEALHEGGQVLIRVTDAGIGIAKAEQKRIFDGFYRAQSPENQSIQGAGLGLTLVRQVMRGHHGEVRVQSEPGKGSTFTLSLPVTKEDSES